MYTIEELDKMTIERLMGMQITDEKVYAQYREVMSPLLHEHGGSFKYDFKVSEVLKSPTPEPINRVFLICFPSQEKMDSFFSNDEYLKIKKEFFSPSVGAVTPISIYAR